MGLTEDIADELAREVIELYEKSGDEHLVPAVAKVIGASSTTMEEAFLTAVRVRRAEKRAREMLATNREKIFGAAKPAASAAAPAPQPASAAPSAGSSILSGPGRTGDS